MERTITHIFVHHTAIPHHRSRYQFAEVNSYHKEQFDFVSSLGYYSGYTYLLEWDGSVGQYRAEGETTAAQKGHNKNAIAICLAGDFNIESPTEEQEKALGTLLNTLVEKYNVPYKNILPHRSVNATTCYGSKLPDDWAKNVALKHKVGLLQKMLNALISFARSKGLIPLILASVFLFGSVPHAEARSVFTAPITISNDINKDCGLPQAINGCYIYSTDSIFIKSGLKGNTYLFTVFHELGHYIMRDVSEAKVREAFKGTESMSWAQLQEYAADSFILWLHGWARDPSVVYFFLDLVLPERSAVPL